MAQQLLLFPETEEEKIQREFQELKKSCDKVRKAMFARHGELTKMYLQLHHEFETLKASICKEKATF